MILARSSAAPCGGPAKILAQHRVELELAADLPMVEIDAVLFEQVLFNLLDNAAKYAPAGTDHPHRRLARQRIGCAAGPGRGRRHSAGDLEHIFDKFYRAQKGDHVRAAPDSGLRFRAASSRR